MNTTTKTPNIEKLARLIVRTGNADKIIAALEIVLASGAGDTLSAMGAKQEGGKNA